MFSSILDISSFFIGMLINLLLIALICYYFKRKYESLEVAQNEQAKILYNLLQAQAPRKQFDINELMNNNITNTINTFDVIPLEKHADLFEHHHPDHPLAHYKLRNALVLPLLPLLEHPTSFAYPIQ